MCTGNCQPIISYCRPLLVAKMTPCPFAGTFFCDSAQGERHKGCHMAPGCHMARDFS